MCPSLSLGGMIFASSQGAYDYDYQETSANTSPVINFSTLSPEEACLVVICWFACRYEDLCCFFWISWESLEISSDSFQGFLLASSAWVHRTKGNSAAHISGRLEGFSVWAVLGLFDFYANPSGCQRVNFQGFNEATNTQLGEVMIRMTPEPYFLNPSLNKKWSLRASHVGKFLQQNSPGLLISDPVNGQCQSGRCFIRHGLQIGTASPETNQNWTENEVFSQTKRGQEREVRGAKTYPLHALV